MNCCLNIIKQDPNVYLSSFCCLIMVSVYAAAETANWCLMCFNQIEFKSMQRINCFHNLSLHAVRTWKSRTSTATSLRW